MPYAGDHKVLENFLSVETQPGWTERETQVVTEKVSDSQNSSSKEPADKLLSRKDMLPSAKKEG